MKYKSKLLSAALAVAALILFLILIPSAASAAPLTITESQVSTSGTASNADIYGNTIVWQDTRNGGNDVYMYDRSTNTETRITTSGSAADPAIYGNMIVWSDERYGNYGDIYTYDLSAKKETRITTNGYSYDPDIYENKIVYSNGGISLYDLSTKTEYKIVEDQYDPTGFGDTGTFNRNPTIYGNTIAWLNEWYGGPDTFRSINMYDLSTKKVSEIGGGGYGYGCSSPDINNNRIVWAESEIDRANICVYDFSTGNETIIPISGSDPRIYEDRIVWGNSIYDLSTKSETKITASGSASNPRIYGDKIVWDDSRNGGSDIYLGTMDYKATPEIIWSSPADIVYGAKLSSTQLNAVASVPGIFTYTLSDGTPIDVGAVLNAGTQTLHAEFTPDDAVNYNTASMDVTINVLTPVQKIQKMTDTVQSLVNSGLLTNKESYKLISNLNAAINDINDGNTKKVITDLETFIKAINQDVKTGKLSLSQGNSLIDDANSIINAIK